MTRRPLLPLLAVLAIAVVGCGDDDGEWAAAQSAASADTITVRIALQRANTPIELAKEDGSLASRLHKAGANVEWAGPFPGFAPAVEALNADAVDIALGSITSAVGALAGQSRFTIFAHQAASSTDEALVVKRDAGIDSLAHLEGKRIAVNRGGTGEYVLLKALDDAGLSIDDVQPIYLAPPDAAPAFASGKVDAWATWSVFTALAQAQYGAKVLATGADVGSENDVVYVVRDEFLDEHPEIVEEVFAGLRARANEAAGDPKGTAAVTAALQELPPEIAGEIIDLPQAPLESIDAAAIGRFQRVADYFADRNVIPAAVSLDGKTVDVAQLGGR